MGIRLIRSQGSLRLASAVVAVSIGVVGVLLACSPWPAVLDTVTTIAPPHLIEYGRGEVGIVRPRFARRYLVQAYRVFSGRSPLPNAVPAPGELVQALPEPTSEWARARDRVLGSTAPDSVIWNRNRQVLNYQYIWNCNDDAFVAARRTLSARIDRFGSTSPAVIDWARAQTTVFENCRTGLTVPASLPATADPLVRADREYQIAAAYFYAMFYEEATTRFRRIGNDASSPWRPYGRYLAARATIRLATTTDGDPTRTQERLRAARAELTGVLGDSSAAALHRSARGLIDFIDAKLDPVGRLHALSKTLATSTAVDDQALVDYERLMDRLVSATADYEYAGVRRQDISDGDDLSDWIVALQGRGSAALDRTLARWRETRSTPWLVAALWKLPPQHTSTADVLIAAAALDRQAPAFPTAAFLRVRLLARSGREDEARAILATLPDTAAGGYPVETVNLLKAERLMLARTFDEFLANAPRAIVDEWTAWTRDRQGRFIAERRGAGAPSLDEDAATTFTYHLPLTHLVTASSSPLLPERIRVRVASAAFTRAVVLRREREGERAADSLRTLAPQLRADLDRYLAASTREARHRAGVLLLLRTPGITAAVRGRDDTHSFGVSEPERTFDSLRRNWWCGFDGQVQPRNREETISELVNLLYTDQRVPSPAFLSSDDRAAAEQEIRLLAKAGAARSYLAAEAIEWAQSSPRDLDAAEALSAAVRGWRVSCGDDEKWPLSREAFRTLHRQYPGSMWAQRTKYWYR
jgi:hypothetical protein